MKAKSYLVLVLAVAAIALGWFWLERSTRPPAEITTNLPQAEGGKVIRPVVPTFEARPPSLASDPASSGGTDVASAGEMATPAVEEQPAPPATLTAGDILADPDEDYVRVAKKLAALVRDPRVPLPDREEALAHTLNLSAGNEAEVLTPIVTDAALPDSLAETVLAEALNRPLAFQADLYLAALKTRKSPEMQKMLRDHLAFLTNGEDLGNDPEKWLPAITLAKKSWE